MDRLDLSNPVFAAYALAASLMILKTLAMAWLTVWKMMQVRAGFRAPEDLRKTPLNPAPHPDQLKPDERVERFRRIHMNDLENVPFFLAAGFLFLFTDPGLTAARLLFFGYVALRLAHFVAYATGQTHDLRATLWTGSVLIILWMTGAVIWAAV